MVDGQSFQPAQTQTFSWPIGSVHSLVVASAIQPYQTAPAVFTFVGWTCCGANQATNSSTTSFVTASPSVTQYTAVFSASYALTVTMNNNCGAVACGGTPGQILLNGSPLESPGPTWYPSGTPIVLTALPNIGYTFAGWTPGAYQSISGNTDSVNLSAPVTAVANFSKAAPITFDSSPEGLRLVVDTVPTTAPLTEQLGWGSVHTVSAISPQQDITGNYWVFSSWNDGGNANHTYTVPQSSSPVDLVATFTPGVLNTFLTSPPGLSLTIDGRSNWNTWAFAWAVGSTHTFSAPATQTDAQGRMWSFVGWSNGGAESQTLTVPAGQGATYTATYQQLAQLTVTSNLSGLSVSVNGSTCTTPCTVQPPLGTEVTISAPASVPVSANSRQDLLGWSTGAGPGNLTMTAPATATTVTANYHLMNQLVKATSPANAATWNLQPASADGFYDTTAVVNISLSPLPGFQFRNWSGDLNGIAPFGTVVMSQPRTVTALFAAVPYLPTGAVANAAGSTPSNGVAPGSAVSIFGVNLADDVKVNLDPTMPQTLDGVTVAIGSRLLPLYFVSPTQINVQLPPDIPAGPATLVVTTPEQAQVTADFTVAQDGPGLFSVASNDKAYALAFHADGSLVTEASPAAAGEVLTVYGTGFGPTTPVRPEGLPIPASPLFTLNDPASVQVATASFPAQTAYALSGSTGIDVVQFALGAGAPSGGDFQLTVTINQVVSNTVLLPVK